MNGSLESASSRLRAGSKARVLLIDDHAILRDGVRILLEGEEDLQVVAEAGSVAEGLALSRRLQPDIAIIDISFPSGSGLGVIGELRRDCIGTRVIVLTIHDTPDCARSALKAGAHGFVGKGAGLAVLLAAIRSAGSAQQRPAASVRPALSRGGLTERERQVLLGIAYGYSTKQIAARLGRSAKTIDKHRSTMMKKLSLADASAVTRFAVDNGYMAVDGSNAPGGSEY